MERPAGQVRQGAIWTASVADRNGFAKVRPVMIVTATDEVVLDEPIVLAAITSQFPDPPPQECVALPWAPGGHPATRLWKRSAVVCTWLVEVRPSALVEYKGYVPLKTLQKILLRLREVHGGDRPAVGPGKDG